MAKASTNRWIVRANTVKAATPVPTRPISRAMNPSSVYRGVSSSSPPCVRIIYYPVKEYLPTAHTSIWPFPTSILDPEIRNGSSLSSDDKTVFRTGFDSPLTLL